MCDTVVVRTDDGLLFAKNSDRDPNEAQVIRWFPAADHPDGATVACTGKTIAQVPHTHAIAIAQPWWLWGAEMGANEHGVVIGNEGVFNRRGHAKVGLLGMDLVRLGLERAATASEAVATIVDLIETHGQGGSHSHDHPGFRYDNSFLVADRNEAIVLETARREWATLHVTGRVRSISNGYTIPGFARSHADPIRARVAQCVDRRCRTEAACRTATAPIGLFAAMRDHGDSGQPRFNPINGALGAPCAHAGGFATATTTVGSWVGDLRGDPLHWVTATAAPCTSLFKPIRVGDPIETDHAVQPTNRFDARVGWWRHELLHRLVMRDHAASTSLFAQGRDRLEADWVATPPPSVDAWKVAHGQEADWYERLVGAGLTDRRPAWLRRLTGRSDRAAQLPDPFPENLPDIPAAPTESRGNHPIPGHPTPSEAAP